MAASVPRFLRQTRLGYLPLNCIIGSHTTQGAGGSNLFFDLIMLPVPEFTRMRSNVGLQHVIAPALKAGPSFTPSFVLSNTREVVVPEDEPDPEAFAKNYFLVAFGLIKPEASQPTKPLSPFARTAREYMTRHKK